MEHTSGCYEILARDYASRACASTEGQIGLFLSLAQVYGTLAVAAAMCEATEEAHIANIRGSLPCDK